MSAKHVLYVTAKNHMDPMWLRAFRYHFDAKQQNGIVHGYADVEEQQILEYMDFAEKYGVKYQIEQSAVVKNFLANNPDQKERFTALVKKGLFELAGGGEYVIDQNMTRGESWVRNHLYNIKYYQQEFGYKAKYGICPDLFGLPCQLPQFFRSIGYDAITLFDRVMLNNKPYWKGLDGTLIVLDPMFLMPKPVGLRTADCVKIGPCPICKGKGCFACDGSGLDPTYDATRPDKVCEHQSYYGNMSADELFEALLKQAEEAGVPEDYPFHMMMTTEETRVGDYLYGQLLEAAPRHDFEVKFMTIEENFERWLPGKVEALRQGKVPQDEIDDRVEGNPVFTGCYTSLIEIKKEHRQLEAVLDSAERLSAFTWFDGGWNPASCPRRDYPQNKIAGAWNKMGFVEFHDAITGTHCDKAYEEVLQTAREIRRSGMAIASDAAKEWLRDKYYTVSNNQSAIVVFNTSSENQDYVDITVKAPADWQYLSVSDADGKTLKVFDVKRVDMRVGCTFTATVHVSVSGFGYRVLVLSKADVPAENEQSLDILENEYYVLKAEGNEIVSVFDKKINKQILGKGALGLVMSDYNGGAYCRWGGFESELDNIMPTARKTIIQNGVKQWIFEGEYACQEKKVDKLKFVQTVSLRDDEPLVRVHMVIDWEGHNRELCAAFPLAYHSDSKLYCEVPFGQLARKDFQSASEGSSTNDCWPSLDYCGATDGETAFVVFKKGLYGTRLDNDVLRLQLMHAEGDTNESDFSCHNEAGVHECDYAIGSVSGNFSDGWASHMAEKYVSVPVCAPIPANGTSKLTSAGSLFNQSGLETESLRVSAVKLAEDGTSLVIRLFETCGGTALLKAPAGTKLIHCNPLEENDGKSVDSYAFAPFEIASFRVIKK